jgi:hypothetical protein
MLLSMTPVVPKNPLDLHGLVELEKQQSLAGSTSTNFLKILEVQSHYFNLLELTLHNIKRHHKDSVLYHSLTN